MKLLRSKRLSTLKLSNYVGICNCYTEIGMRLMCPFYENFVLSSQRTCLYTHFMVLRHTITITFKPPRNQNMSPKTFHFFERKTIFSGKTCTIKCYISILLFQFPSHIHIFYTLQTYTFYEMNSLATYNRQANAFRQDTAYVSHHMLFRIQFISSSLLSHHL